MTPTLKRTLWLLLGSSVFVSLALVTGLPQRGAAPADASVPPHAAAVPVESEQAFIAQLIPHHQEAVASAEQLLVVTERPEMQALARDIIRAQTAEIETLRAWLARWYPDAGPAPAYAPMMRDLRGMAPEAADRAFMEDMLRHHDMALETAAAYRAGDFEKRPEVVALAEDVATAQAEENARMRAWLSEWYGGEHGGH